MKIKVKENYKTVETFLLGGIIFGSIGVYATVKLTSSEISYDNRLSGLKSTTLNGAIDELYEKANACETGSTGSGNLIAAYTYNTTNCITGEESTCERTTCYKNKQKGSCPNGTIVQYRVNNDTAKYFHVIHDDGNTMTMQQRENTIYNTAWYAGSADNSKGPITILSALENATSNWTNVNNQTYTMGTTNFNGTNAYTGCSYTNGNSNPATCTKNSYTLGSRTARARMITVQEAASLGCTYDNRSCPKYMNNYLYESTSYGGTVDDGHTENGEDHNKGYWTMSAWSANTPYAWIAMVT